MTYISQGRRGWQMAYIQCFSVQVTEEVNRVWKDRSMRRPVVSAVGIGEGVS